MTAALTKQPTPPQKFTDGKGSLTFESQSWFNNLLSLLDAAEINVRFIPKQLFAPILLTGTVHTLYTCPAPIQSPGTVLMRKGLIKFTNTTNGALTVTAYAVPKGGTANDTGNAFLVAFSIAANSFNDIAVPVLSSGDFIQAKASGSIMATAIDGAEYT